MFFQTHDKISARAARGRLECPGQPKRALPWNMVWGVGGGGRVPRSGERGGLACPKVGVNLRHVYQGSASRQV